MDNTFISIFAHINNTKIYKLMVIDFEMDFSVVVYELMMSELNKKE